MSDVSVSAATEVFISYSSTDRDRIAPIVQVVRAMKPGKVFQDCASIVPGERWRERVMDAISHAKTLVVFWCEHSAASEHVAEEYGAGIELRKEILPIRLDDTELPTPLREFHWIDFRRPEGHGGLVDFVYRAYSPSGRHYYPKDEHGEFRDWDGEEFARKEFERRQEWEASQAPLRQAVAQAIVSRLDAGGA